MLQNPVDCHLDRTVGNGAFFFEMSTELAALFKQYRCAPPVRRDLAQDRRFPGSIISMMKGHIP